MYFQLETNYFEKPTPYRSRLITDLWGYDTADWKTGKVMDPPSEKILVDLWERGGKGLADIYLDSVPLISDKLLLALADVGVSNIQAFPASLRLPDNTGKLSNYKAINVVGLLRCADLGRSDYDDICGTGIMTLAFRKLVIDEQKANDALFFRLAESVSSIIVHEKVKNHLDGMNFKYLSWRELVM